MSLKRKVLGHTLLFSAFRAVGLGISLVSFPVLTRQLSVSEYGTLALINASVAMIAAVAKSGLGLAMIRSVLANPDDHERQRNIVGAAFWGTLLTWALIAAFYVLVVGRYVRAAAQLDIFLTSLVTVMAASSALNDLFSALLRARDQVFRSSVFGTGMTLASVSCGLVGLVLSEHKLLGFCIGSVSAELVILAFAWGRQVWTGSLAAPHAVFADARNLFVFGLPLVMSELSFLAMSQADRFQIAHFVSLEAVGLYSVGYNIAAYVQAFLLWPMGMALFPIYTRLWESEGAAAVESFLSDCLRVLMVVSCAIVMCVAIGSADAIQILAGEKYASAAPILLLVCTAVMIHGFTNVLGAGLYLNKKTGVLAAIAAGGACLKVVVNIWMIPWLGILGAALSTLLSYFLMTVAITLTGGRVLRIRWSATRLLLYAGTAAIVAWIAFRIRVENPWLELFVRGALALPAYVATIFMCDRRVRDFTLSMLGGRLRGFRSRKS